MNAQEITALNNIQNRSQSLARSFPLLMVPRIPEMRLRRSTRMLWPKWQVLPMRMEAMR